MYRQSECLQPYHSILSLRILKMRKSTCPLWSISLINNRSLCHARLVIMNVLINEAQKDCTTNPQLSLTVTSRSTPWTVFRHVIISKPMFSTWPVPSELRNYEPPFSHLQRRDGTTPMGPCLSSESDAAGRRSTSHNSKASPTLAGHHPLCFILAAELSLKELWISSFLVARSRVKRKKCVITVPKPWADQIQNPHTTYKGWGALSLVCRGQAGPMPAPALLPPPLPRVPTLPLAHYQGPVSCHIPSRFARAFPCQPLLSQLPHSWYKPSLLLPEVPSSHRRSFQRLACFLEKSSRSLSMCSLTALPDMGDNTSSGLLTTESLPPGYFPTLPCRYWLPQMPTDKNSTTVCWDRLRQAMSCGSVPLEQGGGTVVPAVTPSVCPLLVNCCSPSSFSHYVLTHSRHHSSHTSPRWSSLEKSSLTWSQERHHLKTCWKHVSTFQNPVPPMCHGAWEEMTSSQSGLSILHSCWLRKCSIHCWHSLPRACVASVPWPLFPWWLAHGFSSVEEVGRQRGGEDRGGFQEGETLIRIYCMHKGLFN